VPDPRFLRVVLLNFHFPNNSSSPEFLCGIVRRERWSRHEPIGVEVGWARWTF
jgi:hypothetical protein